VFNFSRIGKPGAADPQRVELRAGVWRYHPVRHEFEVFAHGGSNPWGLDYDERGQLFMTHCRSYWGRGCTTHIIQGGHYWNQANANHAPFIIANPPEDLASFRNYLLASARYDHGAGGAGKPGSDAIYGGHSHVGTMIYLGDNWPAELRGHLFTHNLGGHQINHQVNRPLGSGFDTVHAGSDQFFCTDPKYVAVDLQYGPDGAVYVIDWYDRQHCHNPNTERWDRSNGRVYRISYAATYMPKQVDLASLADLDLAALQTHPNHWFARTARRLLHERSLTRAIDTEAKVQLLELAQGHRDASRRLCGLWTLHAIGALAPDLASRALADSDEYVRGWVIRLLTDERKASPQSFDEFAGLARSDRSPVVRLHLASAIQRVPEAAAWALIDALAQHTEDREDRNIPGMLWFGLAQRMPTGFDRAFAIADRAGTSPLADYVYWYASSFEGEPLNRVVASLAETDRDLLRRRLAGLSLAMDSRSRVAQPAAWSLVAPRLLRHDDLRVQRRAERLAAVFGDNSMVPRLRELLAGSGVDLESRKHAFAVLSRAQDPDSLPMFLRLLDDETFRLPTISLLARFDASEVPDALLDRFERFPPAERSAALSVLTGRAAFAIPLLDAVASGRLKRDQLTSYHVRQFMELHDPDVDRRVLAIWGRVHQTPAEKQTQITRLEKTFSEAPLWAYDARAGQQHFQKLCAQCHRLGNDGVHLGPELTGTGKHGIRYILENIIDPHAVVGVDFQLTTIETRSGVVISGIITQDNPHALTIRTTTGEVVTAKSDIEQRVTSDKSMMPDGLLESLNDREQLELLKFLSSR
jgi:putative heme-binding domain-containing protein